MIVLEDVKAAIQKYGKNGDNSFECFGITLENNVISETKGYRYYRSRNDDIIDQSEDVSGGLKKIVERFESEGVIKFREISKKITENAQRQKLYFSIKCNIPYEQHIETTNAFFKEIGFSVTNYCIRSLENFISTRLSPGRSPLLIAGIEMGNNHEPLGIKAHLSLERFSDYTKLVNCEMRR